MKSNLNLPNLCLGGWQASGWTKSDPTTFRRLLINGIERGINFIDTAPVYGDGLSETLVGEVLSNFDRSSVIVASKFWPTAGRSIDLVKSLEASLKRLNTDYIDLYQQHWPSASINFSEVLDCLLQLKEQGKIRAIGVSNWLQPEWDLINSKNHSFAFADSRYTNIEYNQICYNLLWRNCENQVAPLMQSNDIGILAYSPLCQGLLAQASFPQVLPADYRSKNLFYKGEYKNTVLRLLNKLNELSKKYNTTSATIAIAWLLAKPWVSSIIVGVTEERQLIENISALNLELESSDLFALDRTTKALTEKFKQHDTMWHWRP